MAVQQNFRTAFNGFNREDVVHYIEFLNAKHIAEVNQLTSELEFLRNKLAQRQESPAVESPAPAAVPAPPEENSALIEQQASRIRELFDENKSLKEQLNAALEEKVQADALLATAREDKSKLEALLASTLEEQAQTETELNAALKENAQTAANLQSALQQQNSFKSHMEEELEAYRRAERTERLARERAEQLYRQANGALADATTKVDDAAGQIGELTDRVLSQLSELQAAVTGSKQALRDAAATMYTIRPNIEEE